MADYEEEIVDQNDSNIFSGNLTLEEALARLRLRLLDLTGRNRLLNFKHSLGKSLQFIQSGPEAVFSRLYPNTNMASQISPIPEPPKSAWVTSNGRLAKPEPKQHATSLGYNTSYDLTLTNTHLSAGTGSGNKVQTLYYAEDLGRHCRKIDREAKLAIEETGANMLYLVFGFLEYPENPTSDKLFQAPLVCLPVRIDKAENGPYTTFSVVYTGEELADNLSLREKVNRDFGLTLPEFDDESSLGDYFDEIEEVIEDMPQWRLRRMMSLTLLSFANMLLVRDLNPENWGTVQGGPNLLLQHPIIRQVFEGGVSSEDATYGSEYAIDDHKHVHLPLIYDADSSQHSALIDVIEGRNLVIEGPPGTGKSQTITNLIATALHLGKKVLFVSEKLAALEVVKARLAQAGLENFILELHSNKTNKKRVIEDIETRKHYRPKAPDGLDALLESMETKRKELKTYADILNSIQGNNQNLTIHKMLWRAEKFRFRAGDAAEIVQGVPVENAPVASMPKFLSMYDTLRYVAKNYDEIESYDEKHPFWGFFPEQVQPGDDLQIQSILSNYLTKFEGFEQILQDTAALLKISNLKISTGTAENLINALSNLAPANADEVAFDLLPELFSESDPLGSEAAQIVDDIAKRINEIATLRTSVEGRWNAITPASSDDIRNAEAFDTRIHALRSADLICGLLPQKLEKVSSAAEAAFRALEVIRNAAAIAGVPYDGTPGTIENLSLVLSIAESAPDDVLYMRHEGLRHSRAHEALRVAATQLAEIKEKQAVLNQYLYLDMTPPELDLKAAILALREGDAWYRVFQGRWRKAIGLHKKLQRTKQKVDAAGRLTQLEDLFAVSQRYVAWKNNAELRSFAGPSYNDQDTPLNALITLSGWVDFSVKHLQSAQIELNVFDPLIVGAVQLAKLRSLKADVTAALEVLARLIEVQSQEFPGIDGVGSLNKSDNWSNRITKMQLDLDEVGASYLTLAGSLSVGTILCKDVIPTVKASHRLPTAIYELENHLEGQQLLSTHFKGTESNLEPVQGALTYGKLIKSARLPAPVEALLISKDSQENYRTLVELVESIQDGWGVISDFAVTLGGFGDVQMNLWLDQASLPHTEYIHKLIGKTQVALDNLEMLQVWSQYIALRKVAWDAGLGRFVDLLEAGQLTSNILPDAFAYRFYASIAESLFRCMPHLSKFNGVRHSNVRTEFAGLDKQIIKLRGQQIARQCITHASPPAGYSAAKVSDKTEMALIDHLISLTLPRTPVRQILKRAGRAVQELKPCFMMGPQAVAQFLEPGHLNFDIVVMDEASQLKPEEALGAIARGKQLVVVGDPKQLPPTSFFSRQNQAGDGDDSQQTAAEDAESILDVCIGHFHPVRTLRWHYRSRHESLIAFSNHYFYKGKLFVFPSPYPKGRALGLHYIPVTNGVYENQMNKIEALRVVDAIVDHIVTRPEDSLGVVTLNIKQRDLIAELWEERRKSISLAEEFETRWAAESMGLFFKNLENVQGDERDCILISTTFGKAPGVSKPRQNFGPISRQGGWRRLNVLFTRARKSIGLITSMQPEDIIADGSTPEGTKALRNYLEYARSGFLPQEHETNLEPDSDFEVSVIELLESWGYSVTPQLGVAGFRIDIAVKHPVYPSTYLAAIECDGATYHSGVSVRDRDRIRQEILESLGWKGKIWRIWSTDWFRSPIVEAKKLYSFLESLKEAPIPAEFIFVEEEPAVAEEVTWEEASEGNAAILNDESAIDLLDEEDEDLEIDIGDFVTYALADGSEEPKTVQITATRTALEHGLIAAQTPLAQMLLGATVGDSVVLRVPGQQSKTYAVKSIKRSEAEISR